MWKNSLEKNSYRPISRLDNIIVINLRKQLGKSCRETFSQASVLLKSYHKTIDALYVN